AGRIAPLVVVCRRLRAGAVTGARTRFHDARPRILDERGAEAERERTRERALGGARVAERIQLDAAEREGRRRGARVPRMPLYDERERRHGFGRMPREPRDVGEGQQILDDLAMGLAGAAAGAAPAVRLLVVALPREVAPRGRLWERGGRPPGGGVRARRRRLRRGLVARARGAARRPGGRVRDLDRFSRDQAADAI